jgi:signal transduction histidine kinase
MRGPTPVQAAWGGAAYCALYALATSALPRPSGSGRTLLATVFLLVPAVYASVAAAVAARASREGERTFWLLLAAASAAGAAGHLLSAAPLGHDVSLVLVLVALMARPERPRTVQQGRAAAVESAAALVLGAFFILYFVVLPGAAAERTGYAVRLARDALPALGALWLAMRVAPTPFGRVYRLLAAGFALAAAAAAYPNWLRAHGQHQPYSPWDVAGVLPALAVAVAARTAPAAGWLRVQWAAARADMGPSLTAAAAALPPLVDLLMRAGAAVPAGLAARRMWLALGTAAVVAALAALRAHQDTGKRPPRTGDADEARTALGEPDEYLQFASGVAHELNNPLTAVSGWAELAVHAGGDPLPLRELMDATRRAAEVVQELQRSTRTARAGA